MRILVAQDTNYNPAPPVTERLLSSVGALTARGKTEIYSNGGDVNNHSLNMPLQAIIYTGQIVTVDDNEQGEQWRGKATSVQLEITQVGIRQTINVERHL